MVVDWLTGARLRGDMDEKYHGYFFMLDVRRAKREQSWRDGDNTIFCAVRKLRQLCESLHIYNYILYRIGGDEFVLISDEQGTKKLAKKKELLLSTFRVALEKKQSTEPWIDALDRAWLKLRGS